MSQPSVASAESYSERGDNYRHKSIDFDEPDTERRSFGPS